MMLAESASTLMSSSSWSSGSAEAPMAIMVPVMRT
jgi:hypothetical protein